MPIDKRTTVAMGLAAALAFSLAACAPEDEGAGGGAGSGTSKGAELAATAPAAKREPVAFTGTEFSYTGPATMAGGRVQVDFKNVGKKSHALMFFRLGEGKTAADLSTITENGPVPSWISFGGGFAGVEAGEEASAVLDLEPGNYVITSFEDEPSDYSKGMTQTLTVTAPTGPQAEEPAADVTVDMTDFAYGLTGELKAGRQMVRFNNKGTQPHEGIILRLPEGMDADQMVASMLQFMQSMTGTTGAASDAMTATTGAAPGGEASDAMTATTGAAPGGEASTAMTMTAGAGAEGSGPPPGGEPTSGGGTSPINVGATDFVSVNLRPGNYMLICFVPDANGKPHVMSGMHKGFTVK